MTLGLDPENPHGHIIPFADHVPRMGYPPIAQLAHVNEPLDAVLELGESPERGQACDPRRHERSDRIALRSRCPRLLMRPSNAQRDLPPRRIDPQHVHLNLVANLHDLRRMTDLMPGQL